MFSRMPFQILLSCICCLLCGRVVSDASSAKIRWANGDYMSLRPDWKIPTEVSLVPGGGNMQYFGCDNDQIKKLKPAYTAQAVASTAFRKVLDDPKSDPALFHFVNSLFSDAFTRADNKTENIRYARDRFDEASRNVVVNEENPKYETFSRIVCITEEEKNEYFEVVKGDVTASWKTATITVLPSFWKAMDIIHNRKEVCPWRLGSMSVFIAGSLHHELVHQTGVKSEVEEYRLEDALELPPGLAIQNAQTYAFAVLWYLAGCIGKGKAYKFVDDKAGEDDVDEDLVISRKLLDIPDGEKLNKTTEADLSKIQTQDPGVDLGVDNITPEWMMDRVINSVIKH